MDLKRHIITLAIISAALSAIFHLNSYLVEKYYSLFADEILLYSIAWNFIYPFIIGVVMFKFSSNPTNAYPWILGIVPIFNILVLGTLIGGDFKDNVQQLVQNPKTFVLFLSIQVFAIVIGGFIGMRLFKHKNRAT